MNIGPYFEFTSENERITVDLASVCAIGRWNDATRLHFNGGFMSINTTNAEHDDIVIGWQRARMNS